MNNAQLSNGIGVFSNSLVNIFKCFDKDNDISGMAIIRCDGLAKTGFYSNLQTYVDMRDDQYTSQEVKQMFFDICNSFMQLEACLANCTEEFIYKNEKVDDNNIKENAKSAMIQIWKNVVEMYNKVLPYYAQYDTHKEILNGIIKKIKEYDNSYEAPALNEKAGCYIATAIYGSYDCPQVWTFRRYKDYYLSNFLLGKIFIKMYYTLSPKFIKIFGKTKWFNMFFKKKLDAFYNKLLLLGYKNTYYND